MTTVAAKFNLQNAYTTQKLSFTPTRFAKSEPNEYKKDYCDELKVANFSAARSETVTHLFMIIAWSAHLPAFEATFYRT
jgi:hypothetical protein